MNTAKEIPLRILIAEDNAVNQKMAIRLLERMGYESDMAANGLEALEAVKRRKYDLILMDMIMPEMDGLEATAAIRKMGTDNQPVIIALTANALNEERDKCFEAGMDDYISKPFTIQVLRDMIYKWKKDNSSLKEVLAS